MTKTNGEKRAVTSKYLVDVCNVVTTIFPYTRALAKFPPSLTLGLVRQHALTKSVMEMTLWDFQACWRPCSSSTYTPGNHLAHSTCSLNGSSYSGNHDLASWKKQVVWSNKRQRERAPAGRKEALQWWRAVLLQGQAMLCPLPNELASTQGAQLYTGLCTPGLRTSNTKAVVRSILIRNYGNSPPPITKIAK